jgi:phage FluMu protein Com
MNRHTGIAPYNARCPICGHECYDGKGPGFIFYACPKCGMVEEDKQNPGKFTKTIKRLVAVGHIAPGVDVMVADRNFAHT